jgi:hypothetical protein
MHNSCVGKVLAEELQGEKKSCEDRHGAGHKAQSQLRFSRLICMLAAAKQHAAMSRSPMWWRSITWPCSTMITPSTQPQALGQDDAQCPGWWHLWHTFMGAPVADTKPPPPPPPPQLPAAALPLLLAPAAAAAALPLPFPRVPPLPPLLLLPPLLDGPAAAAAAAAPPEPAKSSAHAKATHCCPSSRAHL